MHAYKDVDMQMHILMQMNACACICMLGMRIPLAGGAHPGGPYPLGGGTVKPGTQDIYKYIYIYIYIVDIVPPCNDTLLLLMLCWALAQVMSVKTKHCNSHGILHGSGAVGKLTD